MPRSIKKGPFVDHHLMKKVNDAVETNNKRPIKTWSRRSMILPEMVGLTVAVHNGRQHVPILINENIRVAWWHQLCEFVCPPKAIQITPPGPELDPSTGNVEKRPEEFEINMLRCIYCGYCEDACPTEAMKQTEGGPVIWRGNKCIGCRYCEAACPYWARRFNFTQPEYAKDADIVKIVLPYWMARTRRVEKLRPSRGRSTM